jgi:hypothetical protein
MFKLILHRPRLSAQRIRSFDEATRCAGPLAQRLPRVQTVDIACVVGSVGRWRELGADFRPRGRRRPEDEWRFQAIRTAMQRGQHLPLIDLYKFGSDYFVLDGHHRLAAARSLGQLAVEASVTEFRPLARPTRMDPQHSHRGAIAAASAA